MTIPIRNIIIIFKPVRSKGRRKDEKAKESSKCGGIGNLRFLPVFPPLLLQERRSISGTGFRSLLPFPPTQAEGRCCRLFRLPYAAGYSAAVPGEGRGAGKGQSGGNHSKSAAEDLTPSQASAALWLHWRQFSASLPGSRRSAVPLSSPSPCLPAPCR